MERKRIAVVGSGNVATHLALALDNVADVKQVVSRNINNATLLANKLNDCQAIESAADIDPNTDFLIIAVNDDAIAQVAAALPQIQGVVSHTSGSTDISALCSVKGERGVFYPLQTFSRDTYVDVSQVPFFIEGSSTKASDDLTCLASMISQHVYQANSSQRATLHIAAVFGCNFVNHMLTIASQLLDADGYPLDVLAPLLSATVDKAMKIGPKRAQTGPAARGDNNVIDRHLARLTGNAHDIYNIVSKSIQHTKI